MIHDDDRLRQLEADLRDFRPLPPSAVAIERLTRDLDRPRLSLSDRVLAATLSVASLAACTIVGLLVTAPALTPVPTAVRSIVPSDIPTAANAEPLLARADVPTGR